MLLSYGKLLSVARDSDVPYMPKVLKELPDMVYVRIENRDRPLVSMAKPPYLVQSEENHFVLCARDASVYAPIRFRVTKIGEDSHVLQYCNFQFRYWGACPEGCRLLVPLQLMFSEQIQPL